MCCFSWGNVRLPRPFATFTGGQSPNAIRPFTALPKGFNAEDVPTFYIWAPSSLLASPLTRGQSEREPGIAEMLAHCAEFANANQALEKCRKLWLIQQKGRKNEDIKQCLSSFQAVCFVYSYEGHWAKWVAILLVSFFFTLKGWLGNRVWFEERNPSQYNLDD